MPDIASEEWYAGHKDGTVVIIQGLAERQLPHYVRHSPDGFSWGYGGSGPAELARCLLIQALGDKARCGTCGGTGQIVYVGGEAMSVARAESEFEVGDPTSMWNPAQVYTCMECEDGISVEPAMYQQFKFDVVAKMTMDQPWSLPRSQVLAWHRAYAEQRPGGTVPQEEREAR